MILCLVTDRRRFDPAVPGLLDQIRAAVQAGVDLVQIRERDLEAVDLVALVGAAVDVARGSAAKIVVNDRLDVALACGADGVHLRGDSFPASDARRIAPAGFLIGRSVHTVAEARLASDADYLVAGAVFPTASKPAATQWLGIEGLQAIVRAASRPVLAIGGVTIDRIEAVAAAGAAGVAAITLFESSALAGGVAEMRRRFDTVQPAP